MRFHVRALTLVPVLLLCGCFHLGLGRISIVRYVASAAIPTPVKLKHGGDFALFYDGNKKPEIPIRLHAGERLGFERAKDGRVQAVAGEFRMNLAGDAGRAYWKRLNTRDE